MIAGRMAVAPPPDPAEIPPIGTGAPTAHVAPTLHDMANMKTIAALLASSLVLTLVACTGADAPSSPTAGDESDVASARDCDVQKVLCEITPPQCPAGQTPSVNGDCYGPCVKITQCKPSTFDCDQGPALCEIVPPSCPSGQTLTTRDGCFGPCVPTTVCKGAAPAAEEKADCDIAKVKCEITPLQCSDGLVPSVDKEGFCYAGCVPAAQCKPKSFACDQGGPALCEIVPPRCATGERLTTRDGCFGPCVPAGICK